MKSRAAPSKDLEIQGSFSIQNPPPQQKFNFFFPPLPPIDKFIASLFSNLWNFTEISTFSVAEKAQS